MNCRMGRRLGGTVVVAIGGCFRAGPIWSGWLGGGSVWKGFVRFCQGFGWGCGGRLWVRDPPAAARQSLCVGAIAERAGPAVGGTEKDCHRWMFRYRSHLVGVVGGGSVWKVLARFWEGLSGFVRVLAGGCGGRQPLSRSACTDCPLHRGRLGSGRRLLLLLRGGIIELSFCWWFESSTVVGGWRWLGCDRMTEHGAVSNSPLSLPPVAGGEGRRGSPATEKAEGDTIRMGKETKRGPLRMRRES